MMINSWGRRKGRERGFALLIVLWALVLIAFIVAHLVAAGQSETRIASNLVANAGAQAAADGAISEAIYNQSDPRPERRWPVDGRAHEVIIGNTRAIVRLENEAWWINPNAAPATLLEALLRVTSSEPVTAHRLAIAISEWVGSVPVARTQDQVVTDYRAAGRDYAPPGKPIGTLDELGRVIGMSPEALAAIRPHLTLFGPAQPSANSPDPVVAAALAQAGTPTSVQVAADPPPDVLTTRITANATSLGNGQARRRAVVRFGAALPLGYQVLAWSDGR
jgi:general secretion pathway protein K